MNTPGPGHRYEHTRVTDVHDSQCYKLTNVYLTGKHKLSADGMMDGQPVPLLITGMFVLLPNPAGWGDTWPPVSVPTTAKSVPVELALTTPRRFSFDQ